MEKLRYARFPASNWSEKAGYFRRPLPLDDAPEVPVAGFNVNEGVYALDSVIDVSDKLLPMAR